MGGLQTFYLSISEGFLLKNMDQHSLVLLLVTVPAAADVVVGHL